MRNGQAMPVVKPSYQDSETKFSFDEFLLFYSSTEKVTDRRLETNRWNYSVCTAIIIACASILGWATSNPNFLAIALVVVLVLCSMAILFCRFWVAQIRDFKMLNNAKFEVLNQMAKNLVYSSDKNDKRKSFLPFEKEWEVLKKAKAAVELESTSIFVLSSSKAEYVIPTAFTWLFIFIIIAVFILVLLNWALITSPSSLTFIVTQTPTVVPPTPTP